MPDELIPVTQPQADDIDARWRDETSMDFAHDRHSKWEVVSLPEATEAAVHGALKAAHPHRFLIVDKIAWLDEDS